MFWAHFHNFCVQKRNCLPWSADVFWTFSPCKLKKSSGRIFKIFESKNEGISREVQTLFWKFSVSKFYRKGSGRNFTICASKNEAVCCKVETHFGYPLSSEVCEKSSGRIFPIFASKNEAVCRWVQMHLGSFLHASFTKKVVGAFFQFLVQKRSSLPWSSDAFWKFSACKIYRKKFWAQFHDISV